MMIKNKVKEEALRLVADTKASISSKDSIAHTDKKSNAFDTLQEFVTTEKEMEEFVNRKFLLPGLIKEKCHIIFYGPSGVGKTSLSFYLCKEMLDKNKSLEVYYFLLDGADEIALKAKKWANNSRLKISCWRRNHLDSPPELMWTARRFLCGHSAGVHMDS